VREIPLYLICACVSLVVAAALYSRKKQPSKLKKNKNGRGLSEKPSTPKSFYIEISQG